MATKFHNQIADPQTGYVLNPRRSFFSVIVPEETINLVTDPHAVLNTAYFGTYTRQSEVQHRGIYALKGTPAAPSQGIGYTLAADLTANQNYTFSLDLKGLGTYRIYFDKVGGGATAGLKTVRGTGYWQRVSTTAYVTRADLQYAIIVPDQVGDYYVDGFQVENKAYPTTFVSGAMASARGPRDYAWLGSPNRSMSYRSPLALDGGRMVSLSDLGFAVMEFNQLGFAESTNFFEDYAILPGAQYMGSHQGRRTFTLTGNIFGEGLKQLLCKRNSLGTAITGGAAERVRPVTLAFQVFEDDTPVSEELRLRAVYKSGLEGVINNLYQEKAAVVFETANALIEQDGLTAATLSLTESLPSASGAIAVNADGVVTVLGDGCVAGTRLAYVVGPDNNLYLACGTNIRQWNGAAWTTVYTQPSGYTITNLEIGPDGQLYFIALSGGSSSRLFALNLRTNVVDDLGGATFTPSGGNGLVNVLRRGNYNDLYLGGQFTHVGNSFSGTVTALNICKFDVSTKLFTAMSSGLGTDAGYGSCAVYAIVVDSHDLVWVGGNFSNGSAIDDDVHNIAVWDTVQWEKVGNFSTSGTVNMTNIEACSIYALAYDKARDIVYIGGNFVAFRSVPVNTFLAPGLGHVCAVYPKDRDYYQFGRSDVNPALAGLDSVTPLGQGVGYNVAFTSGPPGFYGQVSAMAVACDGRLMVGGSFESATNLATLGSPFEYVRAPGFGIWNPFSQKWENSPVSVTPYYNGIYYSYFSSALTFGGHCGNGPIMAGDFTVGTNWFEPVLSTTFTQPGFSDSFFVDIGNAVGVTSAAVNEVNNSCGARVRPIIQIVGPGKIEAVRNYTNGKYITVRDKTLFAGEVVYIDCSPDNFGMYSNYLGEQTNLVDAGSSFPNFALESGVNKVVVRLTGTDSNSAVALLWKRQYGSIDAACEGSCVQG